GVMFDFYVRTHAGNGEKISEVYLNPKSNTADRLWRDISLNLSRWAYMQVSVEVITRGGPEEEFEDTSFDYAVISQPRYRPYKQLQRKPNVILLVVDTLRSDRLGCYGYHHKTPNIDELASEGVLFENTIATAPWTNPSVFTIHTSLYPSDLWNPMEYETAIAQSVPSEVTTLAEILRRQDYYNVVITDHPGISDDTGYLQGFDKIIKFFKMHSDRSPWGVTTEEDASKMEEITAHILEELEGGPFFLYIHLIYPHYPYAPPASYSDQFTQDRVDHPLPLIEEEKELLSSLYNGEVLLTDDYVGFLIEELMKLGLHRNTIVVFTSDHGEGFWEHGLCEHGNSLFNELLSVPLIIWGPGVSIRPGRVHTKIDLLDLMPTVLELVDVQAGHQLRGKSLVGLIEGSVEEVTTDRLCISEFQYSGDIGGRSIQDEKVKLIYNGTSGHFTAYDLKNDTAELAAGSPQVDLLHYKEKLLRHIATSAEGIVIWFEGVPETEIEALSQGGFESLKTFNFEAQEAVSRSEQAVRVRTDPLTRWQAVALYPKNGSVELRFRSGTFSDEEAGIYIGPDRIRWYEKSLLVSMDDPTLRWDFLSGPRPEVWEEGKEGVWIWTSLKSRSEETALSKETLDMLRAMGYIR
ncbi:MAG: sulfatase, partial [Candidatus Glassbacteria bacterium]